VYEGDFTHLARRRCEAAGNADDDLVQLFGRFEVLKLCDDRADRVFSALFDDLAALEFVWIDVADEFAQRVEMFAPRDGLIVLFDERNRQVCILQKRPIIQTYHKSCNLSLMIEKILTPGQMLGERERLRAAGARLVFTNGVFDLLHVGHVRYLAQARALGDALVVAINSDRTVRELKGPDRPVFNEAERAEILAALRYVDYVTIFDDVSPRSLIARLLPDVLVKGGDYGLDQIHGREEVEAAGGKVISLPFVEGASTTSLIDKMRK